MTMIRGLLVGVAIFLLFPHSEYTPLALALVYIGFALENQYEEEE